MNTPLNGRGLFYVRRIGNALPAPLDNARALAYNILIIENFL